MARAAAGSERILLKLDKLIESNELYEAHQLYRTLHFRMLNSNRHEEAAKLLLKGANLFLDKNQSNSGADLSQLYLDVVQKDPNVEQKLQSEEARNEFAQTVAKLYARITPKSPERLAFAMELSKLDDGRFPIAQINHLIAKQLFKEENYKDSRYFFLNSAAYGKADAADLLIAQHMKEGDPSYVDIHLAHFVLQVLAQTRPTSVSASSSLNTNKDPNQVDLNQIKARSVEHDYAIKVFQAYTSKHPLLATKGQFNSYPLLNFIHLILISIARGNPEEFKMLRQVYGNLMEKDKKMNQYFDHIGRAYFGLQPSTPNTMGGLLGNLLQQFMEASDSEDEVTSGIPSTQSNPLGKSFNRLLPKPSGSSSSSSKPKSVMNEQLDLD